MDRVANRDRGRRVVLCKSCQPFVSEDGRLKVIAQNKDKSSTRLCDYAVDPVTASAGAHRERWHDHTTVEDEDASGRSDQDGYVLGRSIQEFAPAIAALTDGEEMVLALVHPLCQVYSIPRTGQLAYVGHVCNARQKVTEFLKALPTLPSKMPYVKVRPRSFGGRPCMKAFFRVDDSNLPVAFLWLKKNNPVPHCPA